MKKETRVWIRKNFAGFAFAGIAMVIMSLLSWRTSEQYSPVTLAFVYIATMLVVEYMHNNPIRYSHVASIFFWIFYVYIFSSGDKTLIFIRSTIAGAVAGILPFIMHSYFELKDDWEENNKKIREEREYREKLKKKIAAYTGIKEYDIDVLMR